MSISCKRCGETWPRDPRLEVVCPGCRAPVGQKCQRPSQHVIDPPHVSRERAAIAAGYLTVECPAA